MGVVVGVASLSPKMAARYVGTVEDDESQQTRSRYNKKTSRTSATVSFQAKPSVISFNDETQDFGESEHTVEGEEGEGVIHSKEARWRFLIENKRAQQVFRVFDLLNLLVLAVSVPLANGGDRYTLASIQDINNCSEPSMLRNSFRIQFTVITILDFILALVFTVSLIVQLAYALCLWDESAMGSTEAEQKGLFRYSHWIGISFTLLITLSLWWSVGIGIHRSINVCIDGRFYWGFVPRAVSITGVIQLFLPIPIKWSSLPLSELWTLFKLKQLAFVTMFYFIFVFLLALIGVHMIGSLDYFCVFTNETGVQTLAIPITHCFPNSTSSKLCIMNSTNTNVSCVRYNFNFTAERTDDYDLRYRSLVYYGQFRVILDGLFAVYEASTLELWSYMMYTAIMGHSMVMAILFYVLLISFLVILLQQSLFLVVIIEAFSALRSETSNESGDEEKKTKNKQLTVLRSNSDNKLYLHSKEGTSYSDFLGKYSKVLQIIEKFFLTLVFIDAIMIATKSNNMDSVHVRILQGWQVFVSVALFVEVLVIFVFHAICGQVKGFILRPYYWCLIVLAVGGLVAAVPSNSFYDPSLPANGLIIFQALRLPRLIRSFKPLREFFSKITGNKRIVVLLIITLVVILWLAVVNMQIFGYLEPASGCQRVGGGHFGNIFEAFQSTFQIVLNEAWTDLTSEVMCRNTGWIPMNMYFIAIHLFSSLIFLNFFGAVILDNLEYDDDEKQKKLEELQEPKKKHVPWHLKIFKYNKPKHVRPPIDTGFEAPNIEEVELKRFFESGGGHLSGDYANREPHPLLTQTSQAAVPNASQLQRRQSELSSLGLVSSDNSEFTAETPALHGKYNSITAILNYAKVYRQASEEKRTKQTKDSFERAFSTQSDTSLLLESEYNEFRERHRYFDMALFCMPPEHKLRRFCSFLLTAQCRPPTPVGKANNIASRVALNVKYYFQMVLSMLPYVTWIMLLVVMSLIVVHIDEFNYTTGFKYIIPVEVLYVVMMLSWLILKVLANGFILNPNAAIRSLWDVLDWIIVLDCLALLFAIPLLVTSRREESVGAVIILRSPFIHRGWPTVFLAIRVIRPLHAISIVPAFRCVVRELVEGWRNLLLGALIMFLFLFMFASLGVQLFAGTSENNPQAFCSDPTITTENECVGEFVMKLKTSREFLAADTNNNEILVPRAWFQVARDYRFDNVGSSFLTLFYLLTLEGWLECRDLFDSRNTTLAQNANLYMSFYMHTYVFLAVNMVLQLLLGIVVNNFNEHKAGHSFLLSTQQSRWSELLQRIALQRPYKLPPEPRNKARLFLYRFLIHHHYRVLPTIIHSLNTLTLVVPWDTDHTKPPGIIACICLSIFFNSYSLVELTLKLIAFGPKGYFQSWRNIFDVLLAVYSIVYIVFAIIVLSFGPDGISNMPQVQQGIILTALILAVLKAFTVLIKYSAMLNLLFTILNTLIKSIPLIFVVSIILFCYSFVGVVLFSNVRSGESINYDLVNFRTTANSILTMLRSMTGEDWYQIMWDLAVDRPYCTGIDCGNLVLSVIYFTSFTLFVPLILINVFIGVLLEKFSLFYNDDDTKLNYSAIKDFKRKWSVFDNKASGHIPVGRLKLLLRSLEQQQYYTFCLKDGVRERRPFWLTEHHLLLWEMADELQREVTVQTKAAEPGGRIAHHHSFQSVLRMLAYRVEDIYVRLEPQELYSREEHENNIQIDVAEQCILKWLKNYVEPLVKKQQKEAEETTPEISSRRPHAGDKSKLLSMHNMRSQLLDVSSYHQPSFETEDEQDTLPHRHSMYASPVPSEDYNDGEEKENPILAYSYERLVRNAGSGQETEQWAQDWLQLQQEWMERIGEDENYFDDQL